MNNVLNLFWWVVDNLDTYLIIGFSWWVFLELLTYKAQSKHDISEWRQWLNFLLILVAWPFYVVRFLIIVIAGFWCRFWGL